MISLSYQKSFFGPRTERNFKSSTNKQFLFTYIIKHMFTAWQTSFNHWVRSRYHQRISRAAVLHIHRGLSTGFVSASYILFICMWCPAFCFQITWARVSSLLTLQSPREFSLERWSGTLQISWPSKRWLTLIWIHWKSAQYKKA